VRGAEKLSGFELQWWGYRHTNGNYQVKRWYGGELGQAALEDAYSSPFVDKVAQPFEAHGRQQALDRCRAIIRAAEGH